MATIIAIVLITLVVVGTVWTVRKAPAREALPKPRRPFLTELEERKLERELGIGPGAVPVVLPNVPNIKRADGSPCFEVTRDDVVAYATELIAMGQARDVKTALEDLMVSRVSQLEDDQLAAFVLRLQEYAGMGEEDLDDGPF